MITNPFQINEGWTDLTLRTGDTYPVLVLLNDPRNRIIRVEKEDGFRLEITYSAFQSARRWLDQNRLPGSFSAGAA
jgi:hypothetical protein